MKNSNFIFQLSAYDVNKLLPQVSNALEKRTELISREQYPGLWKHTDRFNSVTQGRTQRSLRTKIRSSICLVLGIFLFVPGLMKPQELLIPLLAGAVAIVIGICGLFHNRKHKKSPFDKSAKLLLAGKDTISAEQSTVVSFSEEGMTISTENSDAELVPYCNFEGIIETDDIFLFVFEQRATVLQKLDLTMGNVADFRDFISEKVTKYEVIARR